MRSADHRGIETATPESREGIDGGGELNRESQPELEEPQVPETCMGQDDPQMTPEKHFSDPQTGRRPVDEKDAPSN
jgi:hypothetical protein